MSKIEEQDFSSWGPRHQADLIGHNAAERILHDAWSSGRLPHAWILSGPKGIGKATLAFRFARFLFAQGRGDAGADMFGAGPASLHVGTEDPVFHRVSSMGHADLLVLERQPTKTGDRFRTEITVEDARRLPPFFSRTAGEGGWRVAIVDAADDLNRNAQNAILKILEESPPEGLILLVSHAPNRLLPTIRSRCRRLSLRSLDDRDVAAVLAQALPEVGDGERPGLLQLAAGSPGRAIELHANVKPELTGRLHNLLEALPRLDANAWQTFADALGRNKSPGAFASIGEMIDQRIADSTREAAVRGNRPAVEAWLAARERTAHLFERADAVYLDRKQVLLSAANALQTAARGG
jgi:DNA polymerase-3 subunit delta'